jgi:hypothetical protein
MVSCYILLRAVVQIWWRTYQYCTQLMVHCLRYHGAQLFGMINTVCPYCFQILRALVPRMSDQIPPPMPSAEESRREAIISSYLEVCETVRCALQTHLGAQHTLNTHRQAVLALQTSIQMVFTLSDAHIGG